MEVTKFCQISFAPPKILFQINEITTMLKSEITKNWYDNYVQLIFAEQL